MKQKLTALLLVLLLAVTLVLPVMAAAPYVDDEAALLTLSEVETLEARAAEISEHYGVGVYICIVDDFGDYGYPDAATASYSIYHAQSLGYGSGRDGILLLLSMSNRKYATFVYGDKAEPIFPDAKLIKLEDGFLDDFADDDGEEADETIDLDDGHMYEVTCPACGDVITVDESILALGKIECPGCGNILEFDLGDDEE